MSDLNKTPHIFKTKPFKCLIEGCNASYRKPCMLREHSRKHTGERPFKCDIPGCSSSYTKITHLRRHKCAVHEKSCEVMCEEKGCGQVFSNKYALKKHYNRKHNTAKNEFNCSECSQRFKKKRQLLKHLYVHKEEVPFKCSICNITFSQLHLYNKHKRNHKTYTCDCGVEFNRWTQFCEHRRTSCTIKNIVHKCIICNKIFTTTTNLKQHSLTHLEESQEDIYRCPYINCRRSYKYKKNLVSHIATFHEKCDTSVQCGVPGCQKVLKTKAILKQHIFKMHGGFSRTKTKERKARRDKGEPKICMASTISGVELPLKEHLAVIANSSVHNTVTSKTHKCKRNQPSCDQVVNYINSSSSLNDGMNCNINISSKDTNISIKHVSKDKDKEQKFETEISTGLQVQLENSIVEYTDQNPCSQDEILLSYCDDVLKTLQDHLDKIPNKSPSLVY